jgi:5-formyltetrahydrofolate cyclo-ligase
MEPITSKQQFRQQMLAERASLPQESRIRFSQAAVRRLLEFAPLTACRSVLAYHPFRDELDIRPFLEAARSRGQDVWLPFSLPSERRLVPYRYTGPEVLRKGAYGIMEPDPSIAEPVDNSALEAVIVPGVAFDRRGGRLGYGAGYYDRFLSSLPHKPLLIGCCFSRQLVEQVPVEPHDFPMDFVATEDGIWRAT